MRIGNRPAASWSVRDSSASSTEKAGASASSAAAAARSSSSHFAKITSGVFILDSAMEMRLASALLPGKQSRPRANHGGESCFSASVAELKVATVYAP